MGINSFLCKTLIINPNYLSFMTIVRAATRNGVKGHIVRVKSNERFVRDKYPGNDPRTIAKKRRS